MPDTIALRATARVIGGRKDATDDDWDQVEAVVALDPAQFKSDATAGLREFSHIEVVFRFDRVGDDEINTGAHHRRGARTGRSSASSRSPARAVRTASA